MRGCRCVHVCASVRASVRVHLCVCLRASVCACVLECVSASVRVRVHARACVCVRECAPTCVRPRVRASVHPRPPRVGSGTLVTLFCPSPFPPDAPAHSSARHRAAPPPAHGPGPHRSGSHVCPCPVFSAYLGGALPGLGHGLSRAYPGLQSAPAGPWAPSGPRGSWCCGFAACGVPQGRLSLPALLPQPRTRLPGP